MTSFKAPHWSRHMFLEFESPAWPWLIANWICQPKSVRTEVRTLSWVFRIM